MKLPQQVDSESTEAKLAEKLEEVKTEIKILLLHTALLFVHVTIIWLIYSWIAPKIVQFSLPEFSWTEFAFALILGRFLYAGISVKIEARKAYNKYKEREAKRKNEEVTTWLD
ncbi:hypothetical protein MA9V1_218 [Chryseobacterium phage MA9V-1]|nr:hypothetical protein MA9V1_218 [Chryseobacterium phage MA9V-1]